MAVSIAKLGETSVAYPNNALSTSTVARMKQSLSLFLNPNIC